MVKQFVKRDFRLLLDKLKQMGIAKGKISDNLDKVRRIHNIVYSFALWADKISQKSNMDHKLLFVNDLKSDMIQVIPLLFSGYKKATSILLRSSLENILKHIYFFDHRVEFKKAKISSFYLRFEELCNYIKTHPDIQHYVVAMNIVSILNSKYIELSETIHGKRAITKEITDCLNEIKFDKEFFDECFKVILLFGNLFNFLLVTFHRDILKEFDSSTREHILSNLDKKAYEVCFKTRFPTYK